MKMRKFFAMALVALGATAAFSSCRKDDVYDGPKVEFRDANNKKITEFDENSFGTKGISIYVTLGDKSVSLDRLEISVVADDGTILQPKKLQTEEGKGGDAAGTRFTTIKSLDELKLTTNELSRKGLRIEAKATDSQKKETVAKCMYKAKGGEKPSGTQMVKENTAAYVNHAFGEGRGAYSFSGKKAVTALKEGGTDREIVNLSVSGGPFVHKFGSNAEFTFVKLNSGDVDYATATVEKVSSLIKDAKTEIELAKGDMFIAVAKGAKTFYLAKVTELKDDGYYADGKENATASENGKGYILFSYKSNN